jgi:hypothetical protein
MVEWAKNLRIADFQQSSLAHLCLHVGSAISSWKVYFSLEGHLYEPRQNYSKELG